MAVLMLAGLLWTSCNGNKERIPCDGTTQTWNGGVATIINTNCATSGCHNAGSNDGDFTNYSGIQSSLQNGRFESRVLDRKSMPPNGSLADSVLAKLQCWYEQGTPEN